MPIRPLLLLAALLLACQAAAVAQIADSPQSPPNKPKPVSAATLVEERSGRNTLVVRYPWKVHRHPSIEVRLVTGEQADLSSARPWFFVHEYLKGDVTVHVYHCQDAAAGTGITQPMTKNEIDFEIIGRRNSLGKPSVCIARRVSNDDPAPGAAAVFCLLPSWSLNRGLLNLDLPPEYFAKSGKLFVWFLRDERVLWEQRLDWPGYKK